jgi:hypothetical protein
MVKSSATPRTRLIDALTRPPSVPPASARQLERKLEDQFSSGAVGVEGAALLRTLSANDASYGAAKVLAPSLRETLTSAATNAEVTPPPPIAVYALRVKASVFGHNAPREPQYEPAPTGSGEFPPPNPNAGNLRPQPWPEWTPASDERSDRVYLDAEYEKVLSGTPVVIELPGSAAVVFPGVEVSTLSRSAYGINGKTTRVTLQENWWDPSESDITPIRSATVFAQPEELDLAEEPILQPVCGGHNDLIELDDFYEDGCRARVVVSGERD